MRRIALAFAVLSMTVLVACGNQPPVIESVTVTPERPRANSIVFAQVRAQDPDGDRLTYSYRWMRNGVEIDGAAGADLDLSVPGRGSEGDEITVLVTATDRRAVSEPMTSTRVVVQPAVALRVDEVTRYYGVSGSSTVEIFESIRSNALGDGLSGFASGVMAYELAYPWESRLTGEACVLEAMTIIARITVTLPEFDGMPPPVLTEKWTRFESSVAVHEAEHVTILREHLDMLREEMAAISRQPDCAALEEEIDRIWLERRALESADQDLFHEVESLRISAQCAALRDELALTRRRAAELTARIEEANRALAVYEQRGDVPNYNSMVETHNALVRVYNDLVPLLRTLVDDHTWCAAS